MTDRQNRSAAKNMEIFVLLVFYKIELAILIFLTCYKLELVRKRNKLVTFFVFTYLNTTHSGLSTHLYLTHNVEVHDKLLYLHGLNAD